MSASKKQDLNILHKLILVIVFLACSYGIFTLCLHVKDDIKPDSTLGTLTQERSEDQNGENASDVYTNPEMPAVY